MTVVFSGDSIIVWKQPDRIISAGMAMIRKDVRMSLLEHSQGNSHENIFVFKLITDFDEGKYLIKEQNIQCTIGSPQVHLTFQFYYFPENK